MACWHWTVRTSFVGKSKSCLKLVWLTWRIWTLKQPQSGSKRGSEWLQSKGWCVTSSSSALRCRMRSRACTTFQLLHWSNRELSLIPGAKLTSRSSTQGSSYLRMSPSQGMLTMKPSSIKCTKKSRSTDSTNCLWKLRSTWRELN